MKFCVSYDIHPNVKDRALYDKVYDALSNTILCTLAFIHAFADDEEDMESIVETTYIIECNEETAKGLFNTIKKSIEETLDNPETDVHWVSRKGISFTMDILTVSIDGTDFFKGELSR